MKTKEKSAIDNTLYVDASANQSKICLLKNGKIIEEKVWIGHGDLSETLLVKIQELLEKCRLNLSDLDRIAANPGPGSYTGLRIGITVVNFISWSLQIPVFPAKMKRSKLIKIRNRDQYIAPKYQRPAEITKPKSRIR